MLSAVLLVVFIVLTITWYGLPLRECLLDDGSVLVYNSFNEPAEAYSSSDVAQIRIYTREFYDRRGPDDWGLEMEITMCNGEDFFFSYKEFQKLDESIRGSISSIYRIKSCFDPSIIILEGEENISNVIRDMDLNQQEIDLLCLLFDLDGYPR